MGRNDHVLLCFGIFMGFALSLLLTVEVVSVSSQTLQDCTRQNFPDRAPSGCDLAAQLSMAASAKTTALAAWTSVLVAVPTLVLLGGTLRYTRKMADEAEETRRAAQHAFMSEHRPWISVKCELAEGITIEEFAHTKVRFKLLNSGKSPGVDVRIYGKMESIFHIMDNYIELLNKNYSKIIPFPVADKILPSDGEISRNVLLEIRRSDVERLVSEKRKFAIKIYGFILYKNTIDKTEHSAPFDCHIVTNLSSYTWDRCAESGSVPLKHLNVTDRSSELPRT